jgi:transcriptional regulator
VQVRGHATIHEDRLWLGEQIRQLTQLHEGGREKPWAVDDAPETFIDAQLKGIVGIEIEIASIEGKWKVSQNRPMADRAGVAQGLEMETAPDAPDMARLVRKFGGLA